VVGSDGSVWGLGLENSWSQGGFGPPGYAIFHFNQQAGRFESVPGSLSMLAVGEAGSVWGLNEYAQIYRFNYNTAGFTQVPGSLDQLAVAYDTQAWGVNSQGLIYQINGLTGKAVQVPGLLSSVSVGSLHLDGTTDVWGLKWIFDPIK